MRAFTINERQIGGHPLVSAVNVQGMPLLTKSSIPSNLPVMFFPHHRNFFFGGVLTVQISFFYNSAVF